MRRRDYSTAKVSISGAISLLTSRRPSWAGESGVCENALRQCSKATFCDGHHILPAGTWLRSRCPQSVVSPTPGRRTPPMPEHPISPSSPAMPASNERRAISARQCACALFCGLALALVAPSASAEEGTLNFGFNSAVLSEQARGELDRIAAVLTDPNIEGYSISIDGHTDGVGSSQYNQALSERRAEAARQYLHHQARNRSEPADRPGTWQSQAPGRGRAGEQGQSPGAAGHFRYGFAHAHGRGAKSGEGGPGLSEDTLLRPQIAADANGRAFAQVRGADSPVASRMAGASAQEEINEAGGEFPPGRGEAADAHAVDPCARPFRVDRISATFNRPGGSGPAAAHRTNGVWKRDVSHCPPQGCRRTNSGACWRVVRCFPTSDGPSPRRSNHLTHRPRER